MNSEDVWKDLVVSILAVNNYSLEKAYALSKNLQNHGLLSPNDLATSSVSDIAVKLRNSGYERGEFLNQLIAGRLASLGTFVRATGIKECERVLATRNKTKISDLLIRVHGIGSTVLKNFFALSGA